MRNSKDFELVSNCIQPGAASLLIELSDGCITITHGTDKKVLKKIENAEIGSWSLIWKAIDNIKSV